VAEDDMVEDGVAEDDMVEDGVAEDGILVCFGAVHADNGRTSRSIARKSNPSVDPYVNFIDGMPPLNKSASMSHAAT
jgi:hypothetical protein